MPSHKRNEKRKVKEREETAAKCMKISTLFSNNARPDFREPITSTNAHPDLKEPTTSTSAHPDLKDPTTSTSAHHDLKESTTSTSAHPDLKEPTTSTSAHPDLKEPTTSTRTHPDRKEPTTSISAHPDLKEHTTSTSAHPDLKEPTTSTNPHPNLREPTVREESSLATINELIGADDSDSHPSASHINKHNCDLGNHSSAGQVLDETDLNNNNSISGVAAAVERLAACHRIFVVVAILSERRLHTVAGIVDQTFMTERRGNSRVAELGARQSCMGGDIEGSIGKDGKLPGTVPEKMGPGYLTASLAAKRWEQIASDLLAVASSYEQYRPYYKNQCVDFVLETAGLSKTERATAAYSRPCVLELGAGTGKFTEKFLERCEQEVRFIATEPSLEFMDCLREKQLPIELMLSTANDLKLENDSVDLVVAAQCFHWFANRESILEIHRVMKSGAKFVTIWNTRHTIVPWMKRLEEFLLEKFRNRNTHSQERNQWKHAFQESLDLFTPLQGKHMSLLSITLTLQEFVSYIMTISIFASQSEAEKKESRKELIGIASASPEFKEKGVVEIPFDTEIYWASSYEHHRPYYKNECVDFVLEIAGLSKTERAAAACSRPCVLELGAGTGKFTEKFLERCKQDVHFIAVEPGLEVMEHLQQKQLPIEMMPSLAKDLKLANNSVDLVVAAQSFHWFANRESILEIHRVMKSGAKFVTLWNMRRGIVPWMRRLDEFLLEQYTILNTPTQKSYKWKEAFHKSLDLFTPLQEKHMSLLLIKLTLQEFVSYMMTLNIFASQSEAEKKESQKELIDIASASPELIDKGVIEIPFDTEIYWVSKN